jgi:hypothetical protein
MYIVIYLSLILPFFHHKAMVEEEECICEGNSSDPFPSDKPISAAIEFFLTSYNNKFQTNFTPSQIHVKDVDPTNLIWSVLEDGGDLFVVINEDRPAVTEVVKLTCHHYGCGEKFDPTQNNEVRIRVLMS